MSRSASTGSAKTFKQAIATATTHKRLLALQESVGKMKPDALAAGYHAAVVAALAAAVKASEAKLPASVSALSE